MNGQSLLKRCRECSDEWSITFKTLQRALRWMVLRCRRKDRILFIWSTCCRLHLPQDMQRKLPNWKTGKNLFRHINLLTVCGVCICLKICLYWLYLYSFRHQCNIEKVQIQIKTDLGDQRIKNPKWRISKYLQLLRKQRWRTVNYIWLN